MRLNSCKNSHSKITQEFKERAKKSSELLLGISSNLKPGLGGKWGWVGERGGTDTKQEEIQQCNPTY